MVLGTGYPIASRLPFIAATIGGGPEKRKGYYMTRAEIVTGYTARRTTNKNFAVGFVGVGEQLLDVLFGDEADTTLPVGRGRVEDVEDLEPVLVVLEQTLEFGEEEDVLLRDVGVDERDGRGVAGILCGGAHDLDHGCDTGSASDHGEVLGEVGGVLEVALGTLDA